jgi:predicted NBD/HSP70 family sugar kinase
MPSIALDLGGTRIKMGLVENGTLLASENLAIPSSDSFAAVLPLIETQVNKMMAASGVKSIDGIGMAFPTIVDSDRMRLLYKYVKYNDANDVDLAGWAKSTWGAALVMENDARAALVGEWQYGAGKGVDNLVMVTLGTGVGSGALVNGRLIKGSHYLAGNLGGHMAVNFDGRRCNCGNTGCLESEASSWALPDILKTQPGFADSPFAKGEKHDFEAVFRLAAAGEPFATVVRDRCLDAWAVGILNLVYAYDPERVVIGGGVMKSADVILPFIQNKINHAAWLPANALEVVAAKQPDWAGVLGIGYLSETATAGGMPVKAEKQVKPNYDKYPEVHISGFHQDCWSGWTPILEKIKAEIAKKGKAKTIVVLETYPGVHDDEITEALKNGLQPDAFFQAGDAYLSEAEIDRLTYPDVTDDPIFGFMTRLNIEAFFDQNKLDDLRRRLAGATGTIVVYGTGAAVVAAEFDCLIYADMARWEIQQRMRRKETGNLGVHNPDLEFSKKYKRAYFADWRVADRLKRKLMDRWDFVLDTNAPGNPKMATGTALREALRQTANRPFRVVPFFDPGPWGGQWMKEVCDLDRSAVNYAWCFDCVPEENSLLLHFGGLTMEVPAIDLVFYQPEKLLGENVYARFGAEFPIRFDFLDTMDGGNLSLQVHPLTEYIREHFGMFYTQDESYYILDAKSDACVYLGLKEDIQPAAMVAELEAAQQGGAPFDAEKHVERWAVKKHDHILIPAGTVHCSGKNSMVLEISATPYIFTFKLWDWGRLGLDGLPRPINIARGKENILWDRTAPWVGKNLVNRFEKITAGLGWWEEKTGLHETEFIETRRHWFTQKVPHHTNGGVNVLNLVEGREAVVESPTGAFEPFVVHYAETFIVPAAVGAYTIRPFSEGEACATVKAYVRR